MNKRGLSGVVVTVLIILLSISAIVLIWAFIRPVIMNARAVSTEDFTTSMSILKNSIVYTPDGNLSFSVMRNAGKGNISGINIVVKDITGKSVNVKKPGSFSELESKKFNINQSVLGLANISSISIIPTYSVNGEDRPGSVKDSYTIASGVSTVAENPPVSPPPVCTESWSCSAWSTCVASQQTRTCTDTNSCGTTNNRPALSQSCTVAASAPTDYLFYWNFSTTTFSVGNVADAKGNYPGTINYANSPYLTVASGTPSCIADKCISFLDASGNPYIYMNSNLPYVGSQAESAFTFSFWFKYTPNTALTTDWQRMTTNSYWPVWVDFNSSGAVRAYIYNTDPNTYAIYNNTVSVNNWHFITYVYDTDSGYLYIDGNPAIQKISLPAAPLGSYSLYMGGYYPNILGSLDEIKYYNRALTSQEVSSLYHLYR